MLPGTSTSRSTTTVSVVTPDGRIDTLGGISRGIFRRRRPRVSPPSGATRARCPRRRNVIVADSHRVIGASTARRISTILAFSPVGVDARPDGSIYVADASLGHIVRIAPDGSRTQLGRRLELPSSVVVDRAGRFVYVSEFDGRRISRIDSRTGRVSTIVRR
jgi:DNA-binding beta-propeller fold protein YncE